MLFNRFIRRVELGNQKIRIFFNPVDKPFLYSRKEDDLFPIGGNENGEDTSENENNSKMEKCSSADALSPPNDYNPNPIAFNAEVFGFCFWFK